MGELVNFSFWGELGLL